VGRRRFRKAPQLSTSPHAVIRANCRGETAENSIPLWRGVARSGESIKDGDMDAGSGRRNAPFSGVGAEGKGLGTTRESILQSASGDCKGI
jgi:hypothetical protein